MKKKIGILLALLVLLFAIVAILVALQPSTFALERETVVEAKPEVVFNLVNDFHQWDRWSPWAKLDPDMETTYTGPESGKGAIYTWNGNSEVGEGRMTIKESKPNEEITIFLEFMKPFEATNNTLFTFSPAGDGTRVVWSMSGENNFIAKAFNMLMDMDAMVGASFEQGLADMKAAAEADAK